MRLWNQIRHTFRRRQFEADLSEEIRLHRELSGGAAFASEALVLEDSRAVWRWSWLDSLGQDVRYALRGFRKTPGFALTVIGTIGLGLGLNTTLFSVFNAYVLRPFEVRDPHSLYAISWSNRQGDGAIGERQFRHLRESNGPFSDVLAFDRVRASLDGRGLFGQLVSENYFDMLGAGMYLGRPILPGDRNPIVLSYAAWGDRFGGDPGVIGRKIYLRGIPVEVVGVASPGFVGLFTYPAEFWAPLPMVAALGTDHPDSYLVIGRLKANVSLEQAKSRLKVWFRQQTEGLPEKDRAIGVSLESRATMVSLRQTPAVMVVWAAFGLVLLIACANVSNMMLARSLARQREIGIRLSLGAGRSRLVRQLLTESLLLALPSAAVAFAISEATLRTATWLLFATLPPSFAGFLRIVDLSPDLRVFGFILLVALATTLLFGLAPAIQSTRSRLVDANRGEFSADARPTRLRNALVVAQVAVCSLLLIFAGTVLRGAMRVGSLKTGLDTHSVIDVRMSEQFQAKAGEALATDPGVEEVAAVWHAPLYGSMRLITVFQPQQSGQTTPYNFVSPQFFAVFRIPVLRGRTFTAEESKGQTPVVVVSESAARKWWPGRDALGQTLTIRHGEQRDPYFDRAPQYSNAVVVGIVGDTVPAMADVNRETVCLYFPTYAGAAHNDSLVARVRGDPNRARRGLAATLERVAPSAVDQMNPMDEVAAVASYPYRVSFWLTGFLGGLALALTASGLYGVLSFLVNQRTREIGIRVALGADAGTVLRMVMRQSLALAAIGITIGAGAAAIAGPALAHSVAAVRPYEAVAFAGGVLLVLAASLGASWHPSRRAVRIDPVVTLRCD